MDKNKVFIIVVIIVLFTALTTVTVALTYTLNSLKSINTAQQDNKGSKNEMTANVDAEDIKIFAVSDPVAANLLTEGKEEDTHIIRITVNLALNSKDKGYKKLNKQLTEKMPMIRDTIIHVVRDKNYEEMLRPDAQDIIREEIMTKVQEKFQTNAIIDIYFGEFFVQ